MTVIIDTDSYKWTHHDMYPEGTERVYSYMEARTGAEYPYTVFFGLQYILMRYLAGSVVTREEIEEAAEIAEWHLGPGVFNREGWEYILEEHDGRLPIEIKAVPEGTVVPVGNVLMTICNTDPKCAWLTNELETMLMRLWYPITVATMSHWTINRLAKALERTSDLDPNEGVRLMLHDFGSRGSTTLEAAAIGGAAHLVNSNGTDTLIAMRLLRDYYRAEDGFALSVRATEHSVMTAEGRVGEMGIVERLLDDNPRGVLSVVADSYDYYEFVKTLVSRFRDRVIERDGIFVVRPDSTTKEHPSPADLVLWTLERLWEGFGGQRNSKGFRVLDPHVRVLWGDGITPEGVLHIVKVAEDAGFSAENLVFGMGGALLQKVNRDTQRFAIKASAMYRDGEWVEVSKDPLDSTKASKKGRLVLECKDGKFRTMPRDILGNVYKNDMLEPVFRDGEVLISDTLQAIRDRARVLQ